VIAVQLEDGGAGNRGGEPALPAGRYDLVAGGDHHRGWDPYLPDPVGRGELADRVDGRERRAQAGPPQLALGPRPGDRVVDRSEQRTTDRTRADQPDHRVPGERGGHRRQRQRDQVLVGRLPDIAGGAAQDQTGQPLRVSPVQQLGDDAAHRVPDRDEPVDP